MKLLIVTQCFKEQYIKSQTKTLKAYYGRRKKYFVNITKAFIFMIFVLFFVLTLIFFSCASTVPKLIPISLPELGVKSKWGIKLLLTTLTKMLRAL